MTDEIEQVIREAFRAQQARVDGRDLSAGVRRRIARRQRAIWLSAATMTGAVVIGVATLTVAARGPEPSGALTADSGSTGTPASLRSGWRLESSLGAQIEVPSAWAVNDLGCNMTDRSSVVRGAGVVSACFTPEPKTKELASIVPISPLGQLPDGAGHTSASEALPRRQVTIGDQAALRAEGHLPDGRAAGWIWVAGREVGVEVRTRDAAVTRRILDSFTLVDVDHLGCAATQSPLPSPNPETRGGFAPFLPQRPAAISICFYAGGARLLASAQVTDTEAQALADAVDKAQNGGPNKDRPARECLRTDPVMPDVVLLSGQKRVSAVFSACTRLGLTDGRLRGHLTRELVQQIMAPVHSGYRMLPLE
jgi:hypothetical protein